MVEDGARSTPEKQLLKLIEDPYVSAPRGTAGAVARGLRAFSPGAIKGRFGFFKASVETAVRTWKGPLDVKKVNGLLTVFVVACGVWFAADTAFLFMRLSRLPDFESLAGTASGSNPWAPATSLKSLAYYKEKVASRDLFRLGGEEAAPPAGGETSPANAARAKAEEIASRFKLVGISWSDNPDAMIENSQEQKTYFVKRGQTLGDVRVEAIFKDKIILKADGQEVELR